MAKIRDKRQIENTDNTKTKHNPENAYNEKHNNIHSARKRDGLILQHSWAHKSTNNQSTTERTGWDRPRCPVGSPLLLQPTVYSPQTSPRPDQSHRPSPSSLSLAQQQTSFKQTMKVIQGHQHFWIQLIIFLLKDEAIRYRYIHRDRKKKRPP